MMDDKELIKAVAEEVMGFAELQWQYCGESHPTALHFDPIYNANHWMMVIEKVESMEFIYAFRLFHAYHPNITEHKVWLAQFISAVEGKLTGVAIDNSIGRAVCLAALDAVKGEL